jgi:hypothetical protein
MSDALTPQQQLAALKKQQQEEKFRLLAEINREKVAQADRNYKDFLKRIHQKGTEGGSLLQKDLDEALRLLAQVGGITQNAAMRDPSYVRQVQTELKDALLQGYMNAMNAKTETTCADWASKLDKQVKMFDEKKQQRAAETPEEKKARAQREKDEKAARAVERAAKKTKKAKKQDGSNNNSPNNNSPNNSAPISPVNNDDVIFLRIVPPKSPSVPVGPPDNMEIDLVEEANNNDNDNNDNEYGEPEWVNGDPDSSDEEAMRGVAAALYQKYSDARNKANKRERDE